MRGSSHDLLSGSSGRIVQFEASQASIGFIRERIDTRFVQELQINCFAEVLNAVMLAVAEIEAGEGSAECVLRARSKVDEVKSWALESVKIKFQVCSEVSLAAGREGIEHTLKDHHADAIRCVTPFLERLANPESTAHDRCDVRSTVEDMLLQLSSEMHAISYLKEEDTNIYFEERDNLVELQTTELAFMENVLKAARANPESVALQSTGIEALVKAINVLQACVEQHAQVDTATICLDYANFVLEAIRGHPTDSAIQKGACLALCLLIAMRHELALHVSELGGIDVVIQAMANHTTDAIVQVNGRLAIAAIEGRSTEPSLCGSGSTPSKDCVLW